MSAPDRPRPADVELNMTPMIDVVFNLLIFFMLVTDLTSKEIETLPLPRAERSIPDGGQEDRLIVNVRKAPGWSRTKDVDLLVRGRPLSLEALREQLFLFAERYRDATSGASEARVLIRCDREIRWREVQWVMQACAAPPVAIYRVEIATAGNG